MADLNLIDPNKVDKAIYRALEITYTAELIRRTPRKTGFVALQWETMSLGNFNYAIINPQGDIITFLDEGTAPHTIKPKNKKMLKFPLDAEPRMRTSKDQDRLKKNGEIWFFNKAGKAVLGYKREGSKWFCFARKVNHPGFESRMSINSVLEDASLYKRFKEEIMKAIK